MSDIRAMSDIRCDTPRQQAWHDYCRADERATQLLVDHVNAGGPTPCETPDYESAAEEAARLYARYIRHYQGSLSA